MGLDYIWMTKCYCGARGDQAFPKGFKQQTLRSPGADL